jgi:hypothetical protein
MTTHFLPHRAFILSLASLLSAAHMAHAQSVCSSDGQAAPSSLFERFINADCEACWSDPATPVAPSGALALDWIVPGSQGENAPLAAAASRDAPMRLASLNLERPANQDGKAISLSGWPGAVLRVAHGVALGGYVGASIELTLPKGAQLQEPVEAWLVLVETLPRNFENSPVSRNLVRNVLQPTWNIRNLLQNKERISFKETRPLNIPQGAKPERLQVVGWVQDAAGRVLIAAESTCPPENKGSIFQSRYEPEGMCSGELLPGGLIWLKTGSLRCPAFGLGFLFYQALARPPEAPLALGFFTATRSC